MENKKTLNLDQLENVSGGTFEPDPYGDQPLYNIDQEVFYNGLLCFVQNITGGMDHFEYFLVSVNGECFNHVPEEYISPC